MASSGIINGSCTGEYGKRYNFWLSWSVNSADVSAGTLNITVTASVKRNVSWVYGYNLDRYPSVDLKIGGSTVSLTSREHIDTRNDRVSNFAVWTGDVRHLPDGSLTLPIECSFTLSGVSSLTGGSASGTAVPDRIIRATVPIITPQNAELGKPVIISLPKNDPSYTHTLSWSFGDESGTVDVGDSPSVSWTPPLSLAESITSAPPTGCLTFVCTTCREAVIIGTVSVPVTVTVPASEDTKPCLSVTLEPVNTLPGEAGERYISGLTKIKADFSGSSGKLGAGIASVSLSVGGTSVSAAGTAEELVSPYIVTQEESVTAVCTVTDTRGISTSVESILPVIPYSPPKIIPNESDTFAARCDGTGTLSAIGTYLRISAAVRFSPCEADGTELNSCSLSVAYKKTSEQTWSSEIFLSDITVSEIVPGVTLDAGSAYDVRLSAADSFGKSSVYQTVVPAASVAFHLKHGGGGAAFGKYADTDGLLDVAWKLRSNGGCTEVFTAEETSQTSASLSSSTVADIYRSFSAGNTVEIRSDCSHTVTVCNEIRMGTTPSYYLEAYGFYNGQAIRLRGVYVSGSSTSLIRDTKALF